MELISRIEDAAIDASATPWQRWLDGWLLRFSPGAARRSRCVHAMTSGLRPLDDKLGEAVRLYSAAGLPLVFRLTPLTVPAGLDAALEARGFAHDGESRVMRRDGAIDGALALPAGLRIDALDAVAFSRAIGPLRGSEAAQIAAHAERLADSPVRHRGFVLRRTEDDAPLSFAQIAIQDEHVGLYDVFTAEAARGQGLARVLCASLLSRARERGATIAYLQVQADNAAARRVYRSLGFVDVYGYHYRQAPAAAASIADRRP